MNDVEKRKDNYPSTSSLAKLGIGAVGCTAGGIFLFILQAVARSTVPGLIIGAVISAVGLVSLRSKDPADRLPGAVITAAGALTLLSKIRIPFIGGVAGTLLSIGAIGLLAMGVWNGIKFFKGLKKRS